MQEKNGSHTKAINRKILILLHEIGVSGGRILDTKSGILAWNPMSWQSIKCSDYESASSGKAIDAAILLLASKIKLAYARILGAKIIAIGPSILAS